MDLVIEALAGPAGGSHRAPLVFLLQDAVESGASLGFLPPLGTGEAVDYWTSVFKAIEDGSRVLLVAHAPGQALAGSVQLDLATRPNARHRAEVTKLMVHRGARRLGIGRALMLALEEHARRLGRTTLVLDTRQGDPSESLYRGLGYEYAGAIPRYAESATGAFDATAIYYKLLEPA